MDQTVLVTGGTGYIAQWCIVELLHRGYSVRTTLRDLRQERAVRSAVATQVDPAARLTFVEADLTSDAGWPAATSGCDGVLHVASPLGFDDPRDPDALIVPARDGALRVLRAAVDTGIRRVVMTSAANAASPSSYTENGVTDETLWSDATDLTMPAYRRSKTIAEQSAWAFMETASMERSSGATEFATILPGAVFGPIITPDRLGSVQVIRRLLRGDMPGTPKIGLEVVDVRDIADIHIRALTTPAAAGQRFLATGEFMWMADIARVLRSNLGPDAKKVPTRGLPNVVVRLMAKAKPELRGITPGLGRRNRHTTAKAEALLGWKPRPGADVIVDCARSLVEHRVV